MQGSYFKPDVDFFGGRANQILRAAIRQHHISEAEIELVSIHIGNSSTQGYVTLKNGVRLTVD